MAKRKRRTMTPSTKKVTAEVKAHPEEAAELILYYWDHVHAESRPETVLFRLAMLLFPNRAPFSIVVDGELIPEGDERFAEFCDCYYAKDLRDYKGKPVTDYHG